MIPSPIRKALSTIRRHRVDHLLMGGQACVLYGAAEFSRDLDLALLPDTANLDRLETALAIPAQLESGALYRALRDEEEEERRRDALYWKPLRERIERLRRSKSGRD